VLEISLKIVPVAMWTRWLKSFEIDLEGQDRLVRSEVLLLGRNEGQLQKDSKVAIEDQRWK